MAKEDEHSKHFIWETSEASNMSVRGNVCMHGVNKYWLCQHYVMGPQKTVWANRGCIFSVTIHGWLGYSTLGTADKYLGYRPR